MVVCSYYKDYYGHSQVLCPDCSSATKLSLHIPQTVNFLKEIVELILLLVMEFLLHAY